MDIPKNKSIFDWAFYYRSIGWSVIPVKLFWENNKRQKRPMIEWKEFQNRLATEEEIRQWYEKWPNAQLGVITGKLSNLFVVDIDSQKGGKVPSIFENITTIKSQTQSGGYHLFFKYPKQGELRNTAGELGKAIDTRGEGGYAVLPPSEFTGNSYKWINDPNTPLAELPDNLFKKTQFQEIGLSKNWSGILKGVPEGQRNQMAASVLGKILYSLPVKEWTSVGWELLQAWNERCKPPLELKELSVVFNSISQKEHNRRQNNGERENDIKTVIPDPKSAKELMETEFPATSWLIHSLFTVGTINQISAAPNQWKSWLTQYFAHKVAKGEDVFNKFVTTQMGVLIVNEEDPARTSKNRLSMLTGGQIQNIPVYFYNEIGFQLTCEKVDFLIGKMKKFNLGLIILDSLSVLHEANENSASEMNEVFKMMKLFTKADLTVLFTNHHRKKPIIRGQIDNGQEQTRGSTVINAVPAGHITCEPFQVGNDKFLTITQLKLKENEKIDPFVVKIIIPENKKFIDFIYEKNGELAKANDMTNRIQNNLIQMFKDSKLPLSINDILAAKSGEYGMTAIREGIRKLGKEDIIDSRTRRELGMPISSSGGGLNEKFYFIKEKISEFIKNNKDLLPL